MKNFTLISYRSLLDSLVDLDYQVQIYLEFSSFPNKRTIIIRHDVDRAPTNALKFAELENSLKIKTSYYFRIVPESYKPEIITQIVHLNHEIGYHYENMDTCHGDIDKAWDDFRYNLGRLRKIYPVKTICMHGSPLSKWDNRDLWEKYDYHTEGIISEPYMDIDFNKVLYVTDAGRSWNNENVSIRDKVKTDFDIPINSTSDIVNLLKSGNAPKQIMLNIHPHNWADSVFEWWKIFLWQGMKNSIKRMITLKNKQDI